METYKTSAINNRRYLGNKYKLLPFITGVVRENCIGVESIADVFAGTGAVSSAFYDKIIITNDLMYSNYICNNAWFSSDDYSYDKIVDFVVRYNSLVPQEENYMSLNFADTYFSGEDCRKIGFIREDIEINFEKGVLNERERSILITSLLYAMDKIANTCGHYDAYRKGVTFAKNLELYVPVVPKDNHKENKCYNEDANDVVRKITADLVYLDPPYNSRQYCDAYHLLENVAQWGKPKLRGVARKMDRTNLKSKYCTRGAEDAFSDLIDNINSKYILFSYNNMSNKGNDRSNAKISDDVIIDVLSRKGDLLIFSEKYKPFTTGKSDIQENEERLFLCKCK